MRILVAGASRALGSATLPHLERHEVVGHTRTDAKRELVRKLGAEAVVCNVYDYEALLTVVARARPQTVVNFLTALSTGSEANNQIRREGASNLFAAAERAGAARLVVESVAFPLEGDELRAHSDPLAEPRRRARHGRVTIDYAARDAEHSNAAVLAPLLRRGFPRKR